MDDVIGKLGKHEASILIAGHSFTHIGNWAYVPSFGKSFSLLGSNSSRTQSSSCQEPFVATVGVYDGASGLSLVSVGSFGISDEGVLCRPLHRWHLPDNRQLRPTWPLCRQLKRLLVLRICLRVLIIQGTAS